MRVIGTAGHVDHGKSALVLALTGIDPDRLREEKERGLTIDLGFAWLELPNGEPVGIVDVPGHKDFIENMLAGVGSIDAALFVVAADESVMPQTREHLAILDLLEIPTGVVAVTKIDLAESEEWLELVVDDVADTLEGTVLEDAPIVLTSARAKQGLDELLSTLQDVLAQAQPRSRTERGRPRLPIDRVFTISGFGTVVTGTLIDGNLNVGQEVEIQPQGLEARVRGLQTHKRKIERAVPGSRVAVNLSGVDKDELRRGNVVTTPGWLHATTLVDVQLRYLPNVLRSGAKLMWRPLRHNMKLKLYVGAAEVMARVRLLGQKTLPPGQTGWVQLELQEPLALVKGDRFIVRIPSPSITVGGGIVVEPYPGRKHRRFRPQVVERLETLAEGSPPEIMLQVIERHGPASIKEMLRVSRLGEEGTEALAQLVEEGQAVLLTGENEPDIENKRKLIVSQTWWSTLMARVADELSDYHQKFPLREGMPREALRSGLKLEPKHFDAVMDRAVAEGSLIEERVTVRLPSHAVRLDAEQKRQVEQLLARFHRQPYTTPSYKECVDAVGEEVLGVLIDREELVQVSSDVLFLPETYTEMVPRIREHIEREGSITLAQARDLFDSSRKYAQGLMEHLDQIEVTKRVGDKRVLRQG
jgi:selenocysteine-specific elongation factor